MVGMRSSAEWAEVNITEVRTNYVMWGQLSELERLEQGARTWEPAGQNLLDELGNGIGRRVVDVGCGSLGWLRLLSHWVGPSGTCVGTDFDERMLQAATNFLTKEELTNVELVKDDLFMSALPGQSFDLVHARFQLAPLGRFAEQLAAYVRLVRPGGMLVLEDPDSSSWRFQPTAPATENLIELIRQAFSVSGLRTPRSGGSHRVDIRSSLPSVPFAVCNFATCTSTNHHRRRYPQRTGGASDERTLRCNAMGNAVYLDADMGNHFLIVCGCALSIDTLLVWV
jgi:SAM-dependent methyltransferase